MVNRKLLFVLVPRLRSVKSLCSRGIAAALVLCVMLSTPSRADDTQVWSAVAMTAPAATDSKLMLWCDGHARFSDDAGRLGVSIIRPGMGYRVSDKLTLWLGYARVTQHPGEDIDEDRIWQQATYPLGELFGGSLSGRTRLEQRFRDSDNDTGIRLRQFFRWSHKLGDTPVSYTHLTLPTILLV